ncbi:MAG: FAD:protein FMN transferase [Candidatus Cloacimonetes bacterium]|nr:FAD:protein FMN transferase [Candidatus Cloacimonadota bacterium]
MKRKEIVSLILLILVIGVGFWQYTNRKYTDKRSRIMLDTIVEISVTSQQKSIEPIIEKGFALIEHYEQKFSEYRDSSMVWQINHAEGKPVAIDNEMYELLQFSERLYKDTEGAFDVSVGAVINKWDFDNKIVPTDAEIAEALKFVGFDRIKYTEKEIVVPAGMQLTFGAIAKGYVLDRVAELLEKEDVVCGYVTTRSSYRTFGDSVVPMKVGIQHPRNMNDIIAVLRLKNKSIGTSGDYQQYFEVDNKRYHHIIDARTGYPVVNTFSVTVVCDNAFEADGLSTALFLMEPRKAVEYIKSWKDAETIIYYLENDEIISLKSMGMKRYLDKEYEE